MPAVRWPSYPKPSSPGNSSPDFSWWSGWGSGLRLIPGRADFVVLGVRAGPVVAGWASGSTSPTGLCAWWLQGLAGRFSGQVAGSVVGGCFSAPLMAARRVVIVPVSGAFSGISSLALPGPGDDFPGGGEEPVAPAFDVPAAGLCARVGSAASCSQETRFMARAAMLAQAWLAGKSKNGSFPSPVFFRVLIRFSHRPRARCRASRVGSVPAR